MLSTALAWSLALAPAPAIPPSAPVPAFTGTAAMVGGGLLQLASLGFHAASFTLMRDSCGLAQRDLAAAQFDGESAKEIDREIIRVGGLGIACLAIADQAIRMRVGAGLSAAAAVGLVSTGGLLMGRHDAFHDRFVRQRDRRDKAWVLGVTGATVLGAGIATWAGSRIAIATGRSGCKDIHCFTRLDLASFQASAVITAAGAGMLTWALAYQRRYKLLHALSDTQIGIAPGRGSAMLSLRGRF